MKGIIKYYVEEWKLNIQDLEGQNKALDVAFKILNTVVDRKARSRQNLTQLRSE